MTIGGDLMSIDHSLKEKDLLSRIAELEEKVTVLQKKEAQIDEIIENMLDIICKTDGEGNILYVSSANNQILGYSHEYLSGKSIFDLVHPEQFAYAKSWFRNAVKSNAAIRASFKIRAAGGNYIWLEIIGKTIFDADGKITGIIFTSRDISERMSVEEALRASEERYRKLVELFPEAIFIFKDMESIYANNAGAKLVGASTPEELKGANLLEFVHPDYRESFEQNLQQIKASDLYSPLFEWELLRLDGTKIYVESMFMSLSHNDKSPLLTIIHDITEKKLSEELIQKVMENKRLLSEAIEYDKLRTDFISNISHELRTPLNVILGALQTFKLMFEGDSVDKDNGKVLRYTGIMKQNCYRLLRLVNNLIDITRIDSGFFDIKLKNCNIVSIVEDIVLSVADYTEQKGIALIFDTDTEEKYIACDPDKIERIVLNLLSNAIKFTGPGGSITVLVEDGETSITMRIIDTGIGIAKDMHEDVFERFRQIDKSFTRNHEGSGIGLSLVKSLVELHDGRISVESEEGEGSEFIITLPVRQIEQQNIEESYLNTTQNRIERINIEFSDIYSN